MCPLTDLYDSYGFVKNHACKPVVFYRLHGKAGGLVADHVDDTYWTLFVAGEERRGLLLRWIDDYHAYFRIIWPSTLEGWEIALPLHGYLSRYVEFTGVLAAQSVDSKR